MLTWNSMSLDQAAGEKLVAAISALREPRTTIGGVNLVVGFRPELWNKVAPDHAPAGVQGFNTEIIGKDGFVMPATQHDAVLWLSGSAYDVLFDVAHGAIAAVKELASVAEETSSWAYRHDRDLTGFIDGSENPSLSMLPTRRSYPMEMPAKPEPSFCCRSGSTTQPPGSRFPLISKSG